MDNSFKKGNHKEGSNYVQLAPDCGRPWRSD